MKKRWFTLIEILIVIVIMAILLALSLGISGGRVQILREKYAQEQFISTYNTLFSRNFLTNYYDGILYNNLVIQMTGWEQWFMYSYNTGLNNPIGTGSTNIEWNSAIENLSWWSISNLGNVEIIFEPYKIWCVLSGNNHTWNILDLTLLVDGKKEYCYQINSNLCRLEKIDCPNLNSY